MKVAISRELQHVMSALFNKISARDRHYLPKSDSVNGWRGLTVMSELDHLYCAKVVYQSSASKVFKEVEFPIDAIDKALDLENRIKACNCDLFCDDSEWEFMKDANFVNLMLGAALNPILRVVGCDDLQILKRRKTFNPSFAMVIQLNDYIPLRDGKWAINQRKYLRVFFIDKETIGGVVVSAPTNFLDYTQDIISETHDIVTSGGSTEIDESIDYFDGVEVPSHERYDEDDGR